MDLLGRLSSITNKNSSGTILTRHGYSYDNANRRTSATLHDGSKWKYGYNTKGELISAKKHLPNDDVLAGHQFEYDFDGMGNRTKARYNGDNSGALGREISYTPNALNQYTTIATPPALGVVGQAPAASTVTANGNATTRQGDHFYAEAAETLNSVPNGKWKQVTVTDGTNTVTGSRWMAPESFNPTYDADGNLTNDGRWDYTWNAENRLIKMETTATARAAAVGVPWIIIENTYDYMGRRIVRKQTDKDAGGTVTNTAEHHYRYDGWNCIARTTATATWDAAIYYTWGTDLSGTLQGAGGVGGLLGVKHEASGTATHRSSPCYDGNGNVVAYIDTAGNVITRYEYDAFGNLIRSGGAVNGEQELHLFSTKPLDAATGLYYYGYRYYDPVTGRWPSRDPVGERGGINLYAFAGNDGVNSWDILGNAACGIKVSQLNTDSNSNEKISIETSAKASALGECPQEANVVVKVDANTKDGNSSDADPFESDVANLQVEFTVKRINGKLEVTKIDPSEPPYWKRGALNTITGAIKVDVHELTKSITFRVVGSAAVSSGHRNPPLHPDDNRIGIFSSEQGDQGLAPGGIDWPDNYPSVDAEAKAKVWIKNCSGAD